MDLGNLQMQIRSVEKSLGQYFYFLANVYLKRSIYVWVTYALLTLLPTYINDKQGKMNSQ